MLSAAAATRDIDEDDFDLDVLMAEETEAEHSALSSSVSAAAAAAPRSPSPDEGEEDFAALVSEAEKFEAERPVDPGPRPTCAHCPSTSVDKSLLADYNSLVCYECRAKRKDDYSKLTKTKAKEEYLLSDAQLATLPFRVAPSKARGRSDCKLYLTMQVRELAVSVWKSLESIQVERARRVSVNDSRKAAAVRKREKERLSKTMAGNRLIEADIKRQRQILLQGKGAGHTESSRAPEILLQAQVKLAFERHQHCFETRRDAKSGALITACTICNLECAEEEEL